MAAASPLFPVSSVPLWQRVLPHVLAVLFFVLLACVYFAPIVWEGKSLAQHDIVQFQGGAQEVRAWAAAHDGHEPLWTNAMFSGMPTYLISVHFPGDWSVYLQKILTVGLPSVVSNLFMALLCGYILGIALGLRPLVAVAGAVALGLSSYNLAILAAGHNTKSFALAYAPLVLAGLLVTFRRDKWLGAALFTLGLVLNVRANHPQITYYLALLVGLYGVFELVAAVQAGRLKDFFGRTALLGLGAVLAIGVSFGRLYTTYEYSKFSNRARSELSAAPAAPGQAAPNALQQDRDYAFAYSYGVSETLTLLIPNFYGGSSSMPLGRDSNMARELEKMGAGTEMLSSMPTYWGAQPFTAGPVYVGAVVCFLFILGLFVVDKRMRYWLLLGTLLSFLLAWGKNFETLNNLVFDLLPGYNKFRAVSMGLVMAQLAMPLLAMLALAKILGSKIGIGYSAAGVAIEEVSVPNTKTPTPNIQHLLLYAGAVTSGILILAWLLSFSFDFSAAVDTSLTQQGFTPQLLGALRADRADLLRNDVWRGLFFVGATLAALYFYLKGKLNAGTAAMVVVGLVLVDLWGVDKRYLSDQNFQASSIAQSFQPSPADEQILRDKDLSYRVLNANNPFNEAQTSYFHKSIGGYHGAKLRRYQDLIERQISQNNNQVLNMLNTRYVIVPGQQGQPEQVQRNPGALGNAWFVREVQLVPTPDAEMAALSTINTGRTAVVDAKKFPEVKPQTAGDTTATIALTSYAPDALAYRYNSAQPGTVVFSEVFYADGWQAFLDGKPVPHFRADFVLRAMQVPAGAHEIKFAFEPKEYGIGNSVSLASSVAVLLVLVGAGVYMGRRKAEEA